MTIPQRLADQNHALFSSIDDSGRWGEQPVAIETQDHGIIRSWAECHGLVPAALPTRRADDEGGDTRQLRFTTEADSGEQTVLWADWLTHFDALGLSFVFEAKMATLRLATPLPAPGTVADPARDGCSSPLHVEAASTGRFRVKRARVGF